MIGMVFSFGFAVILFFIVLMVGAGLISGVLTLIDDEDYQGWGLWILACIVAVVLAFTLK